MTLKIGNYTISSQEIYDALKETGFTDDDSVKKFDLNNDKTIDEDELTEVLLDEEDSTDETKKDDDEEDESKDSSTGTSVEDQILVYEELNFSLREQLNEAYCSLATNGDMDSLDGILSTIQSLQDSIENNENSIYKLLVQKEGGTVVGTTSVGASTAASATSGVDGTSLTSSAGTCSKIADYALQYVGNGQSAMQNIMTSKGYRFDWDQWCADFVSFCTAETYGSSAFDSANCYEYGNWARSHNALMDSREGVQIDLSKVKPGDYIMYNAESTGSWYHIGIVTGVNSDGTVNTVEGNTGNSECATHEHVDLNGRGYGVTFILTHNIYAS